MSRRSTPRHGRPAATGLFAARGGRRAQSGFLLVVAMLMLAMIGLLAAATMRNAIGADQVAADWRLLAQADQSAQFALRYCENQLVRDAVARTIRPLVSDPASPAWSARGAWWPSATAAAHTLAAAELGGASPPPVFPQCLAETTSQPDVYVVTARGFSPDYRADPTTGLTASGAVVWVQSTVLVAAAPQLVGDPATTGACETGCGGILRQRVWQRLLTPPF